MVPWAFPIAKICQIPRRGRNTSGGSALVTIRLLETIWLKLTRRAIVLKRDVKSIHLKVAKSRP